MTVKVKQPIALQQLVDPATGALTLDGLEIFQRLVEAVVEQQATTTDHETRITALEP